MCGQAPLAIDNFMKVVRCRDVSRFHSYLVRADASNKRGLILPANALACVLVFELDHRLTLLEPFQIGHKGKFARCPGFSMVACSNVDAGKA